jgi:hypothetical protein
LLQRFGNILILGAFGNIPRAEGYIDNEKEFFKKGLDFKISIWVTWSLLDSIKWMDEKVSPPDWVAFTDWRLLLYLLVLNGAFVDLTVLHRALGGKVCW